MVNTLLKIYNASLLVIFASAINAQSNTPSVVGSSSNEQYSKLNNNPSTLAPMSTVEGLRGSSVTFTPNNGQIPALNSLVKIGGWSLKDPFYDKVFIENKGQYSNDKANIIAGVENSDFAVYFSRNSCQFQITESKIKTENNFKQKLKEDENHNNTTTANNVYANFLNSSDKVKVQLLEGVSNTFGFQHPSSSELATINNVPAFKRLVYKNLYNKIDLEFRFDENKHGLKYFYTLHPEAKETDIQVSFYGADTVFLDNVGNLHIIIGSSELIDQAPTASCDGRKVKIAYSISGAIVSFNIGAYNHASTLIIDPFVANPAFTNQNKAFDIMKDAAGFVYSYGGKTPYKLKKFTATGVLLWTYNTSYTSWYGDLAVDLAGNSYISEGCCGGGLMKISSANAVLFNQNYGTQEFWNLVFNCDYTTLYLTTAFASGGFKANSISSINLTTGAFTGSTVVSGSEPRALAWGPSGNMYLLSCSNGVAPNRVIGVTPAFTNIFTVASGYNMAYNGPTYSNGPNTTSGTNGIAVGKNFFCTSNGLTLIKRDLTTGSLIAQLNIPNGVEEMNSGVMIDDCDNIYVGSSNAVYKYDANLALQTSAATTGAVYCLSEGSNGEILASGNGFIGSYDLSVKQLFLTINVNATNANCGCNGAASANATGGCTTFSYSWSNGSTSQNINNLCAGTYTVSIKSWCQFRTSTVIITDLGICNCTNPPVLSLDSKTNETCGNASGTATVSVNNATGTPPYTYSWNTIPPQTSASATNLKTGTYKVITTDNIGCKDSLTITISNIDIVASFTKGTSTCTNCGCKEWVMVNAINGTPPYTYQWPDGYDKRYKNKICPGNYTVKVTDNNGCSVDVNVTSP